MIHCNSPVITKEHNKTLSITNLDNSFRKIGSLSCIYLPQTIHNKKVGILNIWIKEKLHPSQCLLL